jgi:hypothetical protein
MDAKAVIGEKKIANSKDQNISGRRVNASPHFINRIHKVHFSGR